MDNIFDNERPIYIQLVEKLELEIVSGKLKPRSKNCFCKRTCNSNEG